MTACTAAWREIAGPDLSLALCERLWSAAEESALFAAVRDRTAWEQHRVRLFGRTVACPRLSAWQGEPGVAYAYSGVSLVAAGFAPEVERVRERVEASAEAAFNSALLQLYRDGADCMGWHADDEPELGREPCIASVSLGAPRRFVLRHRTRRELARVELVLPSGSLLVMRGATQHAWLHSLPRTRRPVGPRINLTFRRILAPAALPPRR
jgi:alkylated DNA repair dioxygenase AlkB